MVSNVECQLHMICPADDLGKARPTENTKLSLVV